MKKKTEWIDTRNEDFLKIIESLSYRPAVSVEVEPVTRLERWRVLRVRGDFNGKGSTVHFNGWAEYEGRVSSPILSWDQNAMRGVSRSGRIYQLVGRPGTDLDADYVLGRWLKYSGNPEWEDITDRYMKKSAEVDEGT